MATNTTTLDWLKSYWFIFAFLVATGGAWAGTQVKIQNLEDAVKANAESQKTVVELQVTQSKLDERTKLMLDEQKETQELLKELIKEQRALRKTTP